MKWRRNNTKLLIQTINRNNLIQKYLFKQSNSNYFESPFNIVNLSKMPYVLKDATLNSYSNQKYNFVIQSKNHNTTKKLTKDEGTNTSSRAHIKINSLNRKTIMQKKILLNNSFINEKIKGESLYNESKNNYTISSIRKRDKSNNIEIKKTELNNNNYNIKSYHNSMNHLLKNTKKAIINKRNENKFISAFKTIDFPHKNINLSNNEEVTIPKITQNKIFQQLEQKITEVINKKSQYFRTINKNKDRNYIFNIKLQNKEMNKTDNAFNSIHISERRNKTSEKIFTRKRNKLIKNTNINVKSYKNIKIDNNYISNL